MDKKNQTTSFLMVVGIIFIVIAGTVFVSTAWKYLPTYVKQGILFLTALGLFAGSYKVAKSGVMEKTETSLYYLATSFLGLFTLSLCGGILKSRRGVFWGSGADWNEKAIMIAGVVMLLSVVIRFVRIRRAFDFTLMALLADWVVFWFMMSQNYGILGFCVLSAIVLTAYTVADFLRERWTDDNTRVETVFLVMYIIHIVNFVSSNIDLIFIDDVVVLKTSLFSMSIFMVCITTLHLIRREHKIFRVLNSAAIYWFVITGVRFANEMLSDGNIRQWNEEMERFLIFSICSVCMVVFARMEMIWITVFWGMLMPFIQICRYGGYQLLFSYVKHVPSVYIPFTGVFVAAFAIVIFRKYYEGKLEEYRAKQYGMAVCMQIIVMFIMLYASKYPFFDKGMYSILMLQSLAISFPVKHKSGKMVFRTFALLFGEMLAFVCTNDLISVNYRVEWGCFMAAAGVFLIGVIWQNHGYRMRAFQFCCISTIMIVMLFNVLIDGGVGNALILGITGAVMLIVAAVLNSRRYVIFSSIILILLVFDITKSFWFSIEWWVYLFIAGVVLVALAIKRDKSS